MRASLPRAKRIASQFAVAPIFRDRWPVTPGGAISALSRLESLRKQGFSVDLTTDHGHLRIVPQ